MSRMKAISLGGYWEKIPEFVHEKLDLTHINDRSTRIPSTVCPSPDVIIVIKKFSTGWGHETAKEVAAARGNPPIIYPQTWNYLTHEALACDRLRSWHGLFREVGLPKPVVERSAAVAEPATDMGVSEKQLWESHGDFLTAEVRKIFLPGEKMDEGEFLPILAEAVGLSEGSARRLLPYLAVSGILDNPVGTTWRLLSSDGFTLDLEPAPKPEPIRESQAAKILRLMKGLGDKVYPSRYAIESAMLAHKEFVTDEGRPMKRTRAYHYVRRALDEGVVREENGVFVIDRDPSVVLTPAEKAVAEPPRASEPEPEAEPVKAPEKAAPAAAPLTVTDDVRMLKSMLGRIERPTIQGANPENTMDVIRGVRQVMIAHHWERLAQTAIERRLRKRGVSPRPVPKTLFNQDELDILAWEVLKDFKLELVAPFFQVCQYTETLRCRSCGDHFEFTADEKTYYLEHGLHVPRNCSRCRLKKEF